MKQRMTPVKRDLIASAVVLEDDLMSTFGIGCGFLRDRYLVGYAGWGKIEGTHSEASLARYVMVLGAMSYTFGRKGNP